MEWLLATVRQLCHFQQRLQTGVGHFRSRIAALPRCRSSCAVATTLAATLAYSSFELCTAETAALSLCVRVCVCVCFVCALRSLDAALSMSLSLCLSLRTDAISADSFGSCSYLMPAPPHAANAAAQRCATNLLSQSQPRAPCVSLSRRSRVSVASRRVVLS